MKKILYIAMVGLLAGGVFGGVFVLTRPKAPAPTTQPVQKDAKTQPAEGPHLEPAVPEGGASPTAVKAAQLDELVAELQDAKKTYEDKSARLADQEKRINDGLAMLKQRSDELSALEMRLIEPLRRIKEEQAKLDSSRILVAQQEKANLKKLAATYEKMDPAKAGITIEKMCGSSQQDDAVRILSLMTDRAAAKLLSAISDPALVAKLTEMLKRVKEEV